MTKRSAVGVVGLGIMGSAIASHLIDAGHAVVGFDVRANRRRTLLGAEAPGVKAARNARFTAAATCRDVGQQASIVITSLPSADALMVTVAELAKGPRRPRIVIETSTLPIEVKERARSRLDAGGIILLDCPITRSSAPSHARSAFEPRSSRPLRRSMRPQRGRTGRSIRRPSLPCWKGWPAKGCSIPQNFGRHGVTSKRTRNLGILTILAATGLLLTGRVSAHHGAAGLYDTTKSVMMKGTITKFEWTNPHNQIYFDVKDDKGDVVHWVVATEPPQVMLERGWTRRSLKEGDQVTVYAFIASNGAPVGNLQRIVLPDGKELTAR